MNRYSLSLSVLLLSLLSGCVAEHAEEEAAPVFRSVAEDALFVGNDACASCHEDQYAGYLQHGMGRSMYRYSSAAPVEEFPSPEVVDESTGLRYRVILDAEGLPVQEEILRDGAGEEYHRLVRPMEWVMGSGNAARTYFFDADGWLLQLPITWYTESGKWDFSPGYDQANSRFGRTVPDRCMSCHNGIPEFVPQTNGMYVSIPEGITCERCHGPGSLHVSERLAFPEPEDSVDTTVINPAYLPFERRLDVCQQCHLNGEVSILRDGTGAYGYRPGETLSAHMAVFSESGFDNEDELGVISHVERLSKSACFTADVGSLECTTCHNPHAPSGAPADFGATCLTCHGGEDLPGDPAHANQRLCIDCHMPKVDAEEAPHSSFTDHWIRVVSNASTEEKNASDSRTLTPYFEEDRSKGETAEEYAGMAAVVLGRQRSNLDLITEGRDQLASISAPLSDKASFLLGIAYMDSGDARSAVPYLEAAVTSEPDTAERLNALAQAYQANGQVTQAIERLYTRALRVQPARADIRINYGRYLEARGRLVEAMREYRMASEEEPWKALALFNLGTAHLQNGDLDQAASTLKQSLHLDPTNVEAWGNLGGAYAQRGQLDSTKVAFERAVAIRPKNSLALANLGAFYVNQDDLDQAITLLKRAIEAEPRNVDALANLGLSYLRADSLALARQAAQSATAIDPEHELARQILFATE